MQLTIDSAQEASYFATAIITKMAELERENAALRQEIAELKELAATHQNGAVLEKDAKKEAK